MKNIVDSAMAVAIRAHNGQVNKHDGEPYILHPMRVYIAVREGGLDETHQAVAWLHDVLEDTPVTFHEIQAWFGNEIALAVDSVTKRKGESNETYYCRVLENLIGRRVKIHDINENFGRTMFITDEPTKLRLSHKYSMGLNILTRTHVEVA